ncbi:hypothetical protein [uncultured Umboniibacter sp.]|uniref:hypothetical protein n=1 Tax=uncultured Umboniibacter sp. TaxID=1798917 RepID=UPI0026137F93|nr:hypothetical protein [uncultured Umboniibacter sp.]
MNISELLSDQNPSYLHVGKANRYIAKCVTENRPKLVGRFGSIEGRVVGHYLLGLTDKNDHVLPRVAQSNAGICRPSKRTLKHFACEYISAAANVDLLAAWNFPHQSKLAELTDPSRMTRLSFIDPVYALSQSLTPWTKSLEGKRVLVIHPFKSTIQQQYERRREIPVLASMLPNFDLQIIQPPVTTGANIEYEYPWAHYLSALKREVLKYEFEVAIIGAGSYGLPIASFIKTLGKPAIHLGGVTQLMFAIMGKRWESVNYVASLDKSGWVRPRADETPRYANSIEDGCYW